MEDSNSHHPTPYVKLKHPEWSKNAAIYQINTRQFTKEGTFRAAEDHLPRLKELGVDILWLMPIHEIGKRNRKGSLGSPYAVKNYYSVNPEFGSLDDLKHFVDAAHEQGFKVILDWVANHTAWDNPLVEEHPEWYQRNWKGKFRPTPWLDWTDIIDLDYSQPGLRKYMLNAMKYWVDEVDIDGYRCDVAGFVPIDFWNRVRKELDAIKPVFMLAEFESRDLHAEAFDASYAWSWYEAMYKIMNTDAGVHELYHYYSWNESAYPDDSMRMMFVSNHDENAWSGTQFEQFGDGLKAAIVLSIVGDGIPLIYNGQEAGNPKRLNFFERDPINWQKHPVGDLYKQLLTLKKDNTALWNGRWGASMIRVLNNYPSKVLSFVRQNEDHKVFVVINLSDLHLEVSFADDLYHGTYTDFFGYGEVTHDESTRMNIFPWGYRVYVQ